MKFKAEIGHWSSIVGNSVHLIGEDGRFLGQIAIMCQDDWLRAKDAQTAICEKICAALNADLCASGQQVRALDVDDLAQIILVVDGNNTLGAGELAEAILEAMPVPRIVGALTPAPQPEGQVHRISELRAAIVTASDMLSRHREQFLDSDEPDPEDDSLRQIEAHLQGAMIGDDESAFAPTPSAATPTAQEAVPVWKSVKRKFYRSEWPLAKLLEARNGGLVTDEGEAWVYCYTHKDGVGGEYDMLVRRELVSHPPQPSVSVAEAQIDAIAVALSNRIYKQTEGEWQPSIRQADELARAALRAMKGEYQP